MYLTNCAPPSDSLCSVLLLLIDYVLTLLVRPTVSVLTVLLRPTVSVPDHAGGLCRSLCRAVAAGRPRRETLSRGRRPPR